MSEYDYHDVLRKASDLVAEDGRWVRLAWFHTGKRAITRDEAVGLDRAGLPVNICALGAITLAGERLGVPERVMQGARSRLSWFLRKKKGFSWVADWNDHHAESAFEVANVLRDAADYEPDRA